MKFMILVTTTIPGSDEERERLRPIATRTANVQELIEELVEIVQFAEACGFDAAAFPEQHFHSEGLQLGCTHALLQMLAGSTKRIQLGCLGYQLPAWNPLRLASEVAWFDQLTRGRAFCGVSRGYQSRSLNALAQLSNVRAATSDGSIDDIANRAAFEESFELMKLAWSEQPVRYVGQSFEFPFPIESPPEWPAASWTRRFGHPDELDESGRLAGLNVVPKPYTRPHPPVFCAGSASDETITWAARNDVTPIVMASKPEDVSRIAHLYHDSRPGVPVPSNVGENLGLLRQFYFDSSQAAALKLAESTLVKTFYRGFAGQFGFWETWRSEEDAARYPDTNIPLPPEEWTAARMMRGGYLFAGRGSEIRQALDDSSGDLLPDWLCWHLPQGLMPCERLLGQIEQFAKAIITPI